MSEPTVPQNLLLVEDEALIALDEKQDLEKFGYSVTHILTGEKAVETVLEGRTRFDVILMDVDLGTGMDGTRAAEMILEEKEIPIVFLSSHLEPEVVRKTEKISSYGYVVKNTGTIVLDASIKMAYRLFLAKKNAVRSEARFSSAAEQSRTFTWEIDPEGLYTHVHPAIEAIAGFSPDDMIGRLHFYDLAPVDERDTLKKNAFAIINSKQPIPRMETVVTNKKGESFWGLVSGVPILNPDGSLAGYRGSTTDITEKKLTEIALSESEARYRLLAENSSDLIWTCLGPEENFRMTYINPAVRKMLGYSPEEFLEIPIQDRMTAESLETVYSTIKNIMETGEDQTITIQHVHKEGHTVDCELLAKPIFDNQGNIKSFYGRTIDISRQTAIMKELETAKKLFESVVLQSPVPMAAASPDGRLLLYNDACKKQLSMGDVRFGEKLIYMEKNWQDYDIDGNPIATEDLPLLKSLNGEVTNDLILRVVRKDGSERWEQVFATPIHDESGNIIAGFVLFPDITELKNTQDQIREKELRFKQYIENAPVGIFIADREGNYSEVNQAASDITGYSTEELKGMNITDLLPDSDEARKSAADHFGKVVREGYATGENPFRHKSGEIRFWTIDAVRLSQERFMGYAQDITDRVKMREALQNYKEKLELIIDSVPALIWQKDTESIFTMVNRRFCETISKSREEILGKSEQDLFPKNLSDKYISGDRKVMETKAPIYSILETHQGPDGKERWTRTDKFPCIDSNGRISGTIGFAQDITESKRYEQEIRDQLWEKELLLQEVHHRIKNNLNSIKSLLEIQISNISNPEAADILNEAVARVGSMLHIYTRLLVSEEYGSINVRKYLGDLIDSVIKIFPDSERIRINRDIEDLVLNVKKAVPLGTIINELLTNAMKYAFSGNESGTLGISLTRSNGTFTLTVSDNGPGLADSTDDRPNGGFGLTLVEMLTRQLRGELLTESSPEGLRVTISAPVE